MTKRRSTDDIELFFNHGLDLKTRTIYLGTAAYDQNGDDNGLDFAVTDRFIKSLHILDQISSEPIIVIQNNPGGSWYDGMAVFGSIKSSPSHITFKMLGYCMSMGSIIPQAADKRIIDPYARFMIHSGNDAFAGHALDFQRNADESKHCQYIMESIYLEKIMEKDGLELQKGNDSHLEKIFSNILTRQNELSYPKEEQKERRVKITKGPNREKEVRKLLQELLKFDTFLYPQEVVDLGLADEIGE